MRCGLILASQTPLPDGETRSRAQGNHSQARTLFFLRPNVYVVPLPDGANLSPRTQLQPLGKHPSSAGGCGNLHPQIDGPECLRRSPHSTILTSRSEAPDKGIRTQFSRHVSSASPWVHLIEPLASCLRPRNTNTGYRKVEKLHCMPSMLLLVLGMVLTSP